MELFLNLSVLGLWSVEEVLAGCLGMMPWNSDALNTGRV